MSIEIKTNHRKNYIYISLYDHRDKKQTIEGIIYIYIYLYISIEIKINHSQNYIYISLYVQIYKNKT